MKITRKPKLIAASLIGGTLLLLGGGAVAASLPAPDHMMHMMAMVKAHEAVAPARVSSTAASAPVGVSSPTAPAVAVGAAAPMVQATPTPAASTPSAASATLAPITYVVQPGDTLSGIAAWFKLHGYGDLYSSNAAVIGADPNLIRPGERITISGGVLTMAPPA